MWLWHPMLTNGVPRGCGCGTKSLQMTSKWAIATDMPAPHGGYGSMGVLTLLESGQSPAATHGHRSHFVRMVLFMWLYSPNWTVSSSNRRWNWSAMMRVALQVQRGWKPELSLASPTERFRCRELYHALSQRNHDVNHQDFSHLLLNNKLTRCRKSISLAAKHSSRSPCHQENGIHSGHLIGMLRSLRPHS